MRRNAYSFNPYGITACYAIFFLVRAEENVKNFAEPTALEVPIHELLGNHFPNVDEAPSRSQLSRDEICETVVLQHGIDNAASHQRSQLKVELSPSSAANGEQGIVQSVLKRDLQL
jgi:hypothetical protein